jgi:osmoprotectant transport system substrate-binding protein
LIAGNTTDGLINALDLFVLADDKHYFPPYQAVPVIRRDTLNLHPEIETALETLAGRISDDEMRQLNYAVDGEHRDPTVVVKEFRAKKHF